MKQLFTTTWAVIVTCVLFAGSALLAQPAVRDTALTGFTRTELTPLYYGLGTDRLGGARLETLDSAVVLNLTGIDSSGRYWRVRLAPSLSAFVPVEQVRIDTLAQYPTGGLTGNWTVAGDTAGDDLVAMRLPARLPYRSALLADGHLVIDLFGVASNTNWITQRQSVRMVRNTWFEQLADEILRVHIDLRHPNSWGYSLYYQKTTLMVRIRRGPSKRRALRGMTIAVDAGHGGSNTGAKGLDTGVLEKDMTLDVARQVGRYLSRRGVTVRLTRDLDTNIGPTARIRAMRQLMPDLLVSIHFNSAGSRTVRGLSTYYKHLGFRSLSEAILHELLRIPDASGGKIPEFGNVGHFNFFFNTPTEYPNALVEGPFLSNPADEKLITTPRFRKRMAKAIGRGIRRYVKGASAR